MTLDEIRALVGNSSPNDWYKYAEATAVFTADVDVSLDWSETIKPSFSEPWQRSLSDADASSVSVVLRHNGTPVDRWPFVIVDAGRYILPLPRPATDGGYELSSSMMPLGKLLFGLYCCPREPIKTLADLLKRCKNRVV